MGLSRKVSVPAEEMGFFASAPSFVANGIDHGMALTVTALVGGGLIFRARQNGAVAVVQSRWMAIFLALIFPSSLVIGWRLGTLNETTLYPCHLCDLAALLGAAALWSQRQRLAEIVWFWGMAGTLNGLITPALSEGFPSLRFFSFFALHSGVVIAAVYLVAGLRLRPQPGGMWRAFGWLQVYFVIAALVNWVTGSNYGFLREKPAQASLLDHMGPWPWYLIAVQALALLAFWLLQLPFQRVTSTRLEPAR